MVKLNMEGSYVLTNEKIDEVITKTSAGNYALGKLQKDSETFLVYYVGRSDGNLNARLKKWVGKTRLAK